MVVLLGKAGLEEKAWRKGRGKEGAKQKEGMGDLGRWAVRKLNVRFMSQIALRDPPARASPHIPTSPFLKAYAQPQ